MTRNAFAALICVVFAAQPIRGRATEGFKIWDVQAQKEVALHDVASKLAAFDIVLVGEDHDVLEHHAAQLAIIKAIRGTEKPVAVGLEMFQHRNQGTLDQWSAGKIEEEAFEVHFRADWGEKWSLYRDIFLYARTHGIPMRGLNVPKEITAQVAKRGFASLTPEQIGLLPFVSCRVDGEYMGIMREAHGHAMNEEAFNRFCEAQLVWDTAMAVHSLEFIKKNPHLTLILLAGSIHAWKKGIPAQLQREKPGIRFAIILPESKERFRKSSVAPEDCDYLLLFPH